MNKQMKWYESDGQSVLERLQVKAGEGLSKEDVRERQESGGRNILQPPKKIGIFQKILHQLKDVSVIVLLVAVALSFLLAIKEGSGFIEPFAILAVVIMNLILAITQEGKAERALEALEKMSAPDCTVIRDGLRQKIDAAELTPGDIIEAAKTREEFLNIHPVAKAFWSLIHKLSTADPELCDLLIQTDVSSEQASNIAAKIREVLEL
jgi:magnesium-transporting ATPase (P-type)